MDFNAMKGTMLPIACKLESDKWAKAVIPSGAKAQ
jgi:hypothetical protein